MSEQVESLDTSTESVSLYDIYVLLQAYKEGTINFVQFLEKAKNWSKQVLNDKEQHKITSTEE